VMHHWQTCIRSDTNFTGLPLLRHISQNSFGMMFGKYGERLAQITENREAIEGDLERLVIACHL